jgi:NDP-sugar pyrophosphorylase family protein
LDKGGKMDVPRVVILAAGKGTRMGSEVPKVLTPILDRPLLHHVIDFWRPYTDDFVFVVGHRKEEVISTLPKGSIYVVQEEQKGIGHALLQVEGYVGERFIVALGDCIQVGWFEEPFRFPGIGVCKTECELSKNYAVGVKRGWVYSVSEKPYCGMGTYFFTNEMFRELKTFGFPVGLEIGITEILHGMLMMGRTLYGNTFKGRYINVTTLGDIEKAEEILSESKIEEPRFG